MSTHTPLVDFDVDALDFTKANGLVTVVAQDATTGAVLMVAGADREAVARTIASGEMHYTSRTRGAWHKGATSGNVQQLVSLSRDCDGDAILARVRPAGPACHTGAVSCFGEEALAADAIARTDRTVGARAAAGVPGAAAGGGSYTVRLLGDRNLRLKKLGEEAVELALACADEDRSARRRRRQTSSTTHWWRCGPWAARLRTCAAPWRCAPGEPWCIPRAAARPVHSCVEPPDRVSDGEGW
jgi:phosphoribosyl-ATP pyrophosphohydrolase/phosphoribosyl-AMP cyclohydrolase